MTKKAKYRFTIIGHRPTIPQVTTDDIEVEVEYDSEDIMLRGPEHWDHPKNKAAGEAARIISDRRDEEDDEHPWYFLCATDPVDFVHGYD